MDSFPRYTTWSLTQLAFRVTPPGERANWVATSDQAESVDEAELRLLVTEQLESYGITQADANRMTS